MATRPPHSSQQPQRPVRAPNGNGPQGPAPAPVDSKKGKIKKPSGPIGKAAKFALTPEIGRSFESLKFAWDLLVNIIAQIYVMVDLINKNHPCVDPRNANQYKLRDIIGIAYKNVIWDRAHIPQIAIFFAVGAFLFFIALSIVTLLLGFSVNMAHAATSDGNAANDVLNNIFNLNGNNLIPTAFGGMLAVYANLILVLAGIILFWTITSAVVETMREGKPLGKSFNGTWTPVRLVFGLGLLIPLSSGLNSGQYITLYLAKWGSDVATTVFQKFTAYLSMGQGITISQIPAGSTQRTMEDLFNMSVCTYKAKLANGDILDPAEAISIELAKPGFGVGQNTTMPVHFGATTSVGNQGGCGDLTFNYYKDPQNAEEELKNMQFIYFTRYAKEMMALAKEFVSYIDPQSDNYFQQIQKSKFADEMKIIFDNYHDTVDKGVRTHVEGINKDIADRLTRDLGNSGWVMAPVYYHRLIDANVRVGEASNALPQSSATANWADMFLNSGTNMPEEEDKTILDRINPAKIVTGKIANVINDISTAVSSAFGIAVFTSDNPLITLVVAGRSMVVVASVALVAWIVVAGAVGFAVTVGTNIVLAVGGMMTIIIMLMFSTGLMLGYILPLIPLTRFIFGVLGWLMMVLIAVVGMPLFALAHLRAGGEGFVGQLQVQSAYNMLIGIIIRPTLIVIGLILAMVMFKEIVAIAGPLFMGGISDINGALTNRGYIGGDLVLAIVSLFGAIFLMQIFTSLFIALANACFKLIDIVPSQAMTWMGTGAQQSPAEGGADEFANLAKQDGQTLQQVGMKAPEARGYAKAANQLIKDDQAALFGVHSGGGDQAKKSDNPELPPPDGDSGITVKGDGGGGGGNGGTAQHQPKLPSMDDAGKSGETTGATTSNASQNSASAAQAAQIPDGERGRGRQQSAAGESGKGEENKKRSILDRVTGAAFGKGYDGNALNVSDVMGAVGRGSSSANNGPARPGATEAEKIGKPPGPGAGS